MATMFSEDLWKEAIESVKNQFEIENLLEEQEQAARTFFEKGNVFVNLPIGYGKSLIFQCLPIAADVLYSKPRGSSILLVVSPLRSLMEDQIRHLGDLGIPAIAIGVNNDPEIIQQVINGNFIVVYCSPEAMLAAETWRGIFNDSTFKENLIGVAIDEAHCITQWGLNGPKKAAFRRWYGCLGELRSLIPKDSKIMVLTATATKTTKGQILESLHLSPRDVTFIEQSPDRKNLFYIKHYMDKNEPLENQFGGLILELKTNGIATPRTLIYCQTRKQCAVLFRLFEIYLGHTMFNGTVRPQNRMVEMFHAGTPPDVKEHITSNMAEDDGHIRVLISTIAFGMGVNCKQVRRVIHFGPSKTIEAYVQECGRAGRDGQPSICVLFYNGFLSSHCDNEIKQYLEIEECSRQWLMAHFSSSVSRTDFTYLHQCCSSCMKHCKCGNPECGDVWSPVTECEKTLPLELATEKSNGQRHQLTRVVNEEEKEEIRRRLMDIQKDIVRQSKVNTMVSCPNILLEFNSFHISQVVKKCHHLFTIAEILNSVEIWRYQYAIEILKVLRDVFGDINTDISSFNKDPNTSSCFEWNILRDDSSLIEMLDSQDLEEFGSQMESLDYSHNSTMEDAGIFELSK